VPGCSLPVLGYLGQVVRRVPAIDRLRAVALIMMLVHHFTKWLAGDVHGIIPGWEGMVVTDIAAPAFTIAAGTSAVLYATAKRPPVLTIVRRYGMLVPIGMLLQWLFTSHLPFDWGVLQALGVGVVASTLLATAVRSPGVMAVFATFALVTGPIVETIAEQHTGRLADALGGVFPLVTYTGFALAGATAGLLLIRDPDRGRQALAAGGVFAFVTALMLVMGTAPDRYPGGAAFIIPGIAGTLLLFGALDRVRTMPAAFGNHTLGIFLSHYAICWLITQIGWRDTMSQGTALVVAFGFTALFAVVAPKMPELPWSPRTGWSRSVQKRWASSAAYRATTASVSAVR
jgi:peptidoglycan/LPS O-acetylase OafA/YrhL